VLAWHGTSKENAENIIANNFSLSKLGDNTGNEGCCGAGIYFSEFFTISTGYSSEFNDGGCLLLCRLLPGRSLDVVTGPTLNYGDEWLGAPLAQGYDSHRACKDQKGRGHELVIFDVDQVLPCYLVHFSSSST